MSRPSLTTRPDPVPCNAHGSHVPSVLRHFSKKARVNDFPDDLDTDPSARSFAGTKARIVGGVVLMLIGVATIVGGIIMHFAEKAGRFELFPFAGRLTIVAGIGVICIAIAMAGSR